MRSPAFGWLALAMTLGPVDATARSAIADPPAPTPVLFDTDMGNDIDDALALGVLHALESRGEVQLLAVTSSKDNELSAPYCDLVNAFYGRGDIPVGAVRAGKTPEDSPYLRAVVLAKDGEQRRYPRKLETGRDAPDAVALIRQALAARKDGSVVMVQVGFSTNLARLLDSPADADSPLPGRELVAAKCKFLSMMAGMFTEQRVKEYNVVIDLPAARKVFADWPTPILASGFEIGSAIKFPATSVENDFRYVRSHPLAEAYRAYQKMPYDRETWDLTSVLVAARPDAGYFGFSPPGRITVDDAGVTHFEPDPKGNRRYLTLTPTQSARVREALVLLATQPPLQP